MTPLPGFQLLPDGRLHVSGVRHPLERAATALSVRAAIGALLLHATFFGAVLLVQVLARMPRTGTELILPVDPVGPVKFETPPSIAPGPKGPDLGGLLDVKKFRDVMGGIPDPVFDLDADQPTLPEMWDLALPFDPNAGGEVFGSRGGGGGGWGEVDSDALARAVTRPDDGAFQSAEVMPVLVRMAPPAYPHLARDAGVEGQVIVRAIVDENGRVIRVFVIDGPALFHEAAAEAVRQALFKPALQNGRPVRVWVSIPIRFTLD